MSALLRRTACGRTELFEAGCDQVLHVDRFAAERELRLDRPRIPARRSAPRHARFAERHADPLDRASRRHLPHHQLKLADYLDLDPLFGAAPGRSVLALRALAGLAQGAGEFSLPPDQRFYGGGSGTIRGLSLPSGRSDVSDHQGVPGQHADRRYRDHRGQRRISSAHRSGFRRRAVRRRRSGEFDVCSPCRTYFASVSAAAFAITRRLVRSVWTLRFRPSATAPMTTRSRCISASGRHFDAPAFDCDRVERGRDLAADRGCLPACC